MKKKNLLFILLAIILCISFLVPPAWAGSKQRHRWEGVAIGVGAAILGSALFNSAYCASPRYSPPPRRYYAPPRYCPPPRRHYSPGHWETRNRWIPPRRSRIWHEGCYNRHGHWIPGYWEQRCRPGFWKEKRVWVSGSSCHSGSCISAY